MLFVDFLNLTSKIVQTKLPSESAHIKMAPLERIQSLKDGLPSTSHRNSAVLMLFYPKNGITHFILIQRNTYPGIHSAQISFPGGKQEPGETLEETALREANEEVGIFQDNIRVVMPFTKLYIPPSNFMVYPFLGISRQQPVFSPNPEEVDKIIEVPLDVLLDDSTIINASVNASYRPNVQVPAFSIDGHVVWGATAMILSELKETIKIALS